MTENTNRILPLGIQSFTEIRKKADGRKVIALSVELDSMGKGLKESVILFLKPFSVVFTA